MRLLKQIISARLASRSWLGLLMVGMACCLAAGPARALNLTALYETQAVVTGTGEANRQRGFEECFREVLVKVSGDRRVLDAEMVAQALPEAGSFVSAFHYRDRMEGIPIHDEQGTYDRPHDLTCSFHRERVDAFLEKLGRKPWLAERPRLVVFLAVRQGGKAFALARNGTGGFFMRESLEAAAAPLALSVELPDSATLANTALTADTLPKVEMDDLAAIAARYDGALALAGSLTWSDEDRGWVADWRLSSGETVFEWQRRGISFDEAFRDAMSGSLQILSGNGQPQ
ncbi:DUF2066 domain-containing protein [Kumtagia ephedrae]|uniref:DUF2066 domain-containing protein n=1 Tax=Kumtagia ephedrae TaxID=2116701 RepID=A0A2P7STB7_9HYPH|nr:DUF2066 domain-containing protein [Mesorhizobium ephedrae]PSJ65733.1 DUF2066 domain-containing protein [Mesorhizobium ephedrae]